MYLFKDAWPSSLGSIEYSTTDGQVVMQDATVSFTYRHFVVENTTE
jgi:hypothetical protein